MTPKVICSVLIFTALAVACDPFDSNRKFPSDAKLESNLKKNAAVFSKLVQMSNEDTNVIRIAFNFTRLETNWAWPRPESQPGFSTERWRAYRKLFPQAGLESGLDRDSNSNGAAIFLTAASKGMTFRGSSKGYVYSTGPLSPIVESLDGLESQPAASKHGTIYKKVHDHWHLFLNW
jgi:hypothetical protein